MLPFSEEAEPTMGDSLFKNQDERHADRSDARGAGGQVRVSVYVWRRGILILLAHP